MTPITRLNPILSVAAAPSPSPPPGRGGDFQSMLQDLYAGEARDGRPDQGSRAGGTDDADGGKAGNTSTSADRPDADSQTAQADAPAPAPAPAQAPAPTPAAPAVPPEGTAAAAASATPTTAPAASACAPPSTPATTTTATAATALRAGAGAPRGLHTGGGARVAPGDGAGTAQGAAQTGDLHGPHTAPDGTADPLAAGGAAGTGRKDAGTDGQPGQPGQSGAAGPFGAQDIGTAPQGLAGLLQGAIDAGPAGASPTAGHPGELPAAGLQNLQGLAGTAPGTHPLTPGGNPPASAMPVYQAELPFHPHAPGFAPGLAAQVNFLLDSGLQQAQLRLHPADLGPIQIQLSLSAQTADISFSAASSITRESITDALPALREMLASQGLALGQAGVSSQQADGQPGWQARSSPPAPFAVGAGAADGSAGGAAGIEARPRNAAPRRGVLDLYA